MTNKLPVVREGSTAKTTSFCSARLDGPGGLHLFFDGNGKITAENGTLDNPRPNAFSLLDEPSAIYKTPEQHGMLHCPGSTPTCRASCYVQNLRAAQPELHAMYEHNSSTIRQILDEPPWDSSEFAKYRGFALRRAWALHVADWIKKNAAGGFRWHVSGDVFSLEYAKWIADVVCESGFVDHWIYTRSFQFLEPLAEIETSRGGNLALNLSIDKDNWEEGFDAALRYGNPPHGDLRVCYLVTSADEEIPYLGPHDVIFPDYPLRLGAKTFEESAWWQSLTPRERGLVCPVDARGKAENRRCGLGANQCGRCLK